MLSPKGSRVLEDNCYSLLHLLESLSTRYFSAFYCSVCSFYFPNLPMSSCFLLFPCASITPCFPAASILEEDVDM